MNCKKVFAHIIKHHCKGDKVMLVADYNDITIILKLLLCLPDSFIEDISITRPKWDNYDEAWLLCYGTDNDVWCSKAINSNGNEPFRGEGYYIIDSRAINGRSPESFVIEGSTIKLIGGDEYD